MNSTILTNVNQLIFSEFTLIAQSVGSTTIKRGHEIHRSISSLICFDGLPLSLGGSQEGNGT